MTEHAATAIASPFDDLPTRLLAEELFDALRAKTSDGIGITRASYGDGESKALDIIESKARALGQGFLRTDHGAFEHELTDRTSSCRRRGHEGSLGLRREPEVELGGACGALRHGFSPLLMDMEEAYHLCQTMSRQL